MQTSRNGLVPSLCATLFAVTSTGGAAAFAANLPDTFVVLAGMRGVGVEVAFTATAETERDGLPASVLRGDVERALRQRGVRVLSPSERLEVPGKPMLRVFVPLARFPGNYYAFAVTVELLQEVRHVAEPNRTLMAVTWSGPTWVGTLFAAHLFKVRHQVRAGLDEFIDAYLAVNERR